MVDLKSISEQIKLSSKAMKEIKNQNRIFDSLLHEAVKGAPKEDQKKIEEVRLMSQKVINLAKSGKIEEAQSIINTFKNGN